MDYKMSDFDYLLPSEGGETLSHSDVRNTLVNLIRKGDKYIQYEYADGTTKMHTDFVDQLLRDNYRPRFIVKHEKEMKALSEEFDEIVLNVNCSKTDEIISNAKLKAKSVLIMGLSILAAGLIVMIGSLF